MGSKFTFTCSNCSFSLGVWDEGGIAYIKDPKGKKHPITHPGEMETIEFCARQYPEAAEMNQSELLAFAEKHIVIRLQGMCLDCAKLFTGEEAPAPKKCRSCKSPNTIWLAHIGGKLCPKCRQGHFPEEGEFSGIS